MATIVTRICDKCKKELEKDAQFWLIGVVVKCPTQPRSVPLRFEEVIGPDRRIEVCRPCLEAFGFYAQIKPNEPPPPPRTLEDMIREIIQQELEE